MSDKISLELTRRRALGAVLTIGAGSAAAGAGTFALFSDTETSASNTLSAGTLDLDATTDATDNGLEFQASDIKPGDGGSDTADLTNTGNVEGDLGINLESVTENGGDNPELESTSDDGELSQHLELTLWVEKEDGSGFNGTDVQLQDTGSTSTGGDLSYSTVSSYPTNSTDSDPDTTWSDIATLGLDDSVTFHVGWNLPSDTGNIVQGDEISVSFEFYLEQSSSS